MKKQFIAQLTVALSGAAVIAAGTTLPAIADPISVTKYGELVGLGSDTTMDVMDGISLALGTNENGTLKLASYKAVGSADVVVSPDGKAIPRANGSGAGRDALRVAIGQVGSATVALALDELGKARSSVVPTTQDLAGKIHFGRSSSAPSGAISNGVITYIPFALDNMTYATSPDSKIPSNIPLGSSGNTTEVSLMNIYKGNITKVIVSEADGSYIKLESSSYVPADGEVAHTINAYIPQAGSGTRSFWIGKVGITETNIAAGVTAAKDTFKGFTVQEHDGAALVGDPYALVGFSISQWVAQENGVSPKRTAGAVLRSMGSVEPVQQVDGVYSTSPVWSAIKRPVYNMVPTALANSDTPNAVTRAFVGSDSLVCQAKATIQKYGYGLLSYEGVDASLGLTPGGAATHCGNITEANRTYAPSASTVTIENLGSSDATVANIKATVASNGNQGGTVTLWSGFGTDNQTGLGVGVIAPGQTAVTIPVYSEGSAPLSATITAQFVPNLSGISVSNSTVDGTAISLKVATGVSFGQATTAANGLSASFTATITGGQSGELKVLNGSTVLKTIPVTGGSVPVTVDQVNGEAVTYNLSGEFTPENLEGFSTSVTANPIVVTLKNTTYTSVTVPASIKRTAIPTISVTIKDGKSTSSIGATGSVVAVVFNSKNVPVAASTANVKLVAGKATIKFAKIAALGKYTVKVFYGGSVSNAASVTTKTFTVVK